MLASLLRIYTKKKQDAEEDELELRWQLSCAACDPFYGKSCEECHIEKQRKIKESEQNATD